MNRTTRAVDTGPRTAPLVLLKHLGTEPHDTDLNRTTRAPQPHDSFSQPHESCVSTARLVRTPEQDHPTTRTTTTLNTVFDSTTGARR